MAPITERTVTDLEVELRAARARLADAERELTSINTRLEAFATRYQLVLGDRFERLRMVQADAPHESGQDRGARAAASSSDDPEAARPGRPPGHAEFERFYRDLARRVHPDLARDPSERNLRTQIMAELNNAREALDFDRARKLGTAWELRSDLVERTAGVDRAEYLILAIERVQARLTAVTADITRLQNSNLHLLLNVVEAQERAGIDILAETAADLDRQIAEVRSMSIASVGRRDLIEVQREDRGVDLAAAVAAPEPTTRVATWLAGLVSVACLGILVVVLAADPQDRQVVITATGLTRSLPVQAEAQVTPEPLRYHVVERELSTSGRTTATVRIVVDGAPSFAEKISTIADAARREIGAQQVVRVLAYRSTSEIGGPFTVGRAFLSVDGRGWSGDGSTEDGPDGGRVIGSIVVSVGGTIETQPFSARR